VEWRRGPGQQVRAVLTAAQDLFVTLDLGATTIDAMAARAGQADRVQRRQ
jgi:hypothetical protein